MENIRNVDANECDAIEIERLALVAFYEETGGDSWTNNSGWDSGSAVGNWHGVTVGATDSLLRRLSLPANGLQGTLAPAIGNFRKLETLDVANNSVTGGIPVAVTSMESLDTIRVSGNGGMEGPLPFAMIEMTGLHALQYANTGLCASPSTTFQRWINGLDLVNGATCDNPDAVRLSLPIVYLTQAIQRPSGDVPLLSGREAMLRVFLVGDQAKAFYEPEVVATFTREGAEVHRVVMQSIGRPAGHRSGRGQPSHLVQCGDPRRVPGRAVPSWRSWPTPRGRYRAPRAAGRAFRTAARWRWR